LKHVHALAGLSIEIEDVSVVLHIQKISANAAIETREGECGIPDGGQEESEQ